MRELIWGVTGSKEAGEGKKQKGGRRSAGEKSLARAAVCGLRGANLVQRAEGAFSADSHARSLRQGINRVFWKSKTPCRVSLEDLERNENQAICACLRDISPRLSKRWNEERFHRAQDSALSSLA